MSIAIALSQSSSANPAPAKPLRERLLERALKGDAEAQFELAKNYETGRLGLPQDLSQARHWYREAADQGEPFAALSLGILYNYGKGVKRDYVQAYVWYQRAVAHLAGGDRDTAIEMRDQVAEKLSNEQIAEAQRLASLPAKPAPRKQ
jgi:TPR repeat protein